VSVWEVRLVMVELRGGLVRQICVRGIDLFGGFSERVVVTYWEEYVGMLNIQC
jgi:hypothetical protein